MNAPRCRDACAQQGFVLVTSLIFLVVVTLLAVSAINRSTLQEYIAANTRARDNAQELANAALREAEALLDTPPFNSYQPSGDAVAVSVNDGTAQKDAQLMIWDRSGMFAADQGDDASAFLAPALWASANAPAPYTPPSDADGNTPAAASHFSTGYYVEEKAFRGRDLNPDTAAIADGTVVYRITARAEGDSDAAVAVTQSRYLKYY